MTPADFHRLLRARPFVPFRIITLEGTTYEVHQPELCMVGKAEVLVGHPSPADPLAYDRVNSIGMEYISRLESITSPA